MQPIVESFFDPVTGTFTHVLYAEPGGQAAIIDPVLDYDPKSGRTTTTSADRVIAFVREQALSVQWLLETHVHADHLSAAHYLQACLGGRIGIGEEVTAVQATFSKIFNFGPNFPIDGAQFQRLLKDDEHFAIGPLACRVLAVPGHTPACVAYWVGDALFVGDTLFMPDTGTARCDFPGGDATMLYRSIRRLLELPAATRIFLCHDYPPSTREPTAFTSVAAQREANIHVHDGVSEAAFVKLRTARDLTLAMPVLLFPSIQINIRAGELPPVEDNGTRYLKIPLNAL
jgi:glyoxylase-like metal-dependent hydrolase (beta-lactamase superfamily II)